MQWGKAIGLNCALTGLSFIKLFSPSSRVLDPFCGNPLIPSNSL